MLSLSSKGDFKNMELFFKAILHLEFSDGLHALARRGAQALAEATPKDSGLASTSWGYDVLRTKGSTSILWTNSDIENGFPVVVMLQYGYATGTGGYVKGIDYINPAIQPIFDEIADELWKAVTSA